MSELKTPYIPVSWGELIDKVTILQIKISKNFSPESKNNINNELNYLLKVINESQINVLILKDELFFVNSKLWDVEDKLREKESAFEFDEDFIALARSVYRLNDQRAKIKKSINQQLNSELCEEKSYRTYK